MEGLTRERRLGTGLAKHSSKQREKGGINVLRGQISVGMFLSWRRRWDTVWAIQLVNSSPLALKCPAVIGLPLCSSFYILLASREPGFRDARGRTGTGLRSAM